MKVILWQGPEGAPNFCFGLYALGPGTYHDKFYADEECVDFVQNDWAWEDLANVLGWNPPEGLERNDLLSAAFDWLAERDGQTFELTE